MSEDSERARFAQVHERDVVELTVLTGASTTGASKAGGDTLWTASADVLGYVDEQGAVVIADGRLRWLATDEQRGDGIHPLTPHTQYRVRVRRRRPADPAEYARIPTPVPDFSHTFALDEVVARDLHLPALDERLAQYLLPVSVTADIGVFELERPLGSFSGVITWCGREVSVLLEVDDKAEEGAETCRTALDGLEAQVADATSTDERWRRYAAEKLVDLANDWQEQADEPDAAAITADAFAARIALSELSVSSSASVTPYFDDDDLFWGHAIVIEVEPDGSLSDAYIAG